MKTLKEIATEILENDNFKGTNTYTVIDTPNWNFYMSFSGISIDGEYYDLRILDSKISGTKIIEIVFTTDNPESLVNIIKSIEPMVTIEYYVETVSRIKKTV